MNGLLTCINELSVGNNSVLPSGRRAVYNRNIYFIDYEEVKIREFEIIGIKWKPTQYRANNIIIYNNISRINISKQIVNDIDAFRYEFFLLSSFGTQHSIISYDHVHNYFSTIIDNENTARKIDVPYNSNDYYKTGAVCEYKFNDSLVEDVWIKRTPIYDIPCRVPCVTYFKLCGQWLDEPLNE